MNLTKLFETQKVLRDRIGYNEPDRFNKLVLALLVELGECANEWRGFKFWSKDQEPRTSKYELKKEFQHLHISQTGAYEYQLRDEFGTIIYNDVTDYHHDHKNPLLEEYVDGLHFVLELGLELNFTDIEIFNIKEKNITNQFIDCFTRFQILQFQMRVTGEVPFDMYELAVGAFLSLGKMLGFTREQIEQAYMDKNKVNHERQDEGY